MPNQDSDRQIEWLIDRTTAIFLLISFALIGFMIGTGL